MRIILCLLILTSCLNRPNPSDVLYSTPEIREIQRIERANQRERELELERIRFEQEKAQAWAKITEQAKSSFESIKEVMSRKCFDCHDSSRTLPLYGRLFRRINPVWKHQRDGLRALDLVDVFPIKVEGQENLLTASSQIALLKAIKNSTLDRTMPLRSYTLIYRSRKITNHNEVDILNWVEPIIGDLTEYKRIYENDLDDGSMRYQAKKVFEAKCYRCHANGKDKGGFGDMQDIDKLTASKYVDLVNPEKSELYTIVQSGEMPTNERERLTEAQLDKVLSWIKEETSKK